MQTPSIDESVAALRLLRRHYENPDLILADGPRKALVGRLSHSVPSELILALGRTPVLLKPPLGRPTPTADIYLDPILPPRTHAFFQAALDGDYQALDLLALGRGDDKLYYYLKEILRLGRAPKLPPLHIFDLMSDRPAVRTYNRQQFDSLCAALERACGGTIADEALTEAIAQMDEVRGLQRRLQAARLAGKVSGVDALVALGAGAFMAPAAYAAALAAYVAAAEGGPDLGRRPRLLVLTAEPLSFRDLHEKLEAAGGWVVAEDDPWGARAPGEPAVAASDPRETVFERACRDGGEANGDEAWALAMAQREDIDAVVFYLPPSDRQFGWDYPRLSRAVAAFGKPALLLRQDVRKGDGALDGQVAEFLARRSPS